MKQKILFLSALAAAVPFMASVSPAQAADQYCREYTKTVTIGGRQQQAYGTACYQPDGSWEIVDLKGPNKEAVTQVREVIYQDLGARPVSTSPLTNVVIVERGMRPARFAPRYKYTQGHYVPAYYNAPVVFNFGFGDDDDERYRTKKVNTKYYNHGYDPYGGHSPRGHR